MNIIVVVFSETSFSFDSVTTEKERPYNIKKIIDPKNLFYIRSTDNLKSPAKTIGSLIIEQSCKFYRSIKLNYKNKRSVVNLYGNDKLINQAKYSLKLALVSYVKCLKVETTKKYYKEVLVTIFNIDYKLVEPVILLEHQQVAKWVFCRLFEFTDQSVVNFDFSKMINCHNKLMTKLNYINYEKTTEFDWIPFSENWRCLQLEQFINLLSFNSNHTFQISDMTNTPGYYLIVHF